MKVHSVTLRPGRRMAERLATQGQPVPDQRPVPIVTFSHPSLARLKAQVAFWRRLRVPLASRPMRAARAAVCAGCDHGLPTQGNLILGTCRAPGACCGKGKPVQARSSCPLPQPKWSAMH
jgi:hypothetical protein